MKKASILKGVPTTQSGSTLPPVPSLPTTTVNPQPRNEAAPVAPAKKVVQPVERAGDDKGLAERMTKQDWSNKDRAIERVAIIKSVLESPMTAQLTMGQDNVTALKTFETVFNKAIEVFYSK
jgi:hypothetical protein